MDLKAAANSLGLKYDNEESHSEIHRELRYNFIVHIIRKNKSMMGANNIAMKDIKKAKELAWQTLCDKYDIKRMKKDDVVSFKCFEIVYCDVPVETVLKGDVFQMQPISSRWMTPSEIKELLTANSKSKTNLYE